MCVLLYFLGPAVCGWMGQTFHVGPVTSQYLMGTEDTHLTDGNLRKSVLKRQMHLEYFPKGSSHTENTLLPLWCSNYRLLIYVMDRRNGCLCEHTMTYDNILERKKKRKNEGWGMRSSICFWQTVKPFSHLKLLFSFIQILNPGQNTLITKKTKIITLTYFTFIFKQQFQFFLNLQLCCLGV